MVRILLVDSNEISREAIKLLLKNEHEVEVIGTASREEDAINKGLELKPDVVLLLTTSRFQHIEVIKSIKKCLPDTKFVVLSNSQEEAAILRVVVAGSSCYLSKDISAANLVKNITLAANGEIILSGLSALAMLNRFSNIGKTRQQLVSTDSCSILTKREIEILAMVSNGGTTREVSQALYLSEHTVRPHLHNIIQKPHVRNRLEAINKVKKFEKLKKLERFKRLEGFKEGMINNIWKRILPTKAMTKDQIPI